MGMTTTIANTIIMGTRVMVDVVMDDGLMMMVMVIMEMTITQAIVKVHVSGYKLYLTGACKVSLQEMINALKSLEKQAKSEFQLLTM